MNWKVIITGSTGMVGKGVLFECLKNKNIEKVLVVNRKPLGIQHEKLIEIIHSDFLNLTSIEDQFKDYDACFFCLGVSAFRMSEEDYTRITHDLTLNFANVLLHRNPQMIFCYVSGQGTDGSGKSRIMWARVKGTTENDLLTLPFKKSYMFRPGFIQPMDGIKSSTRLYNALYAVFKPFYPVLKKLFPNSITSTRQVGQAMINTLQPGYQKTHLDNHDINQLAALNPTQ